MNEFIRFGVGVAVTLDVSQDGQTYTCRSTGVFWRPFRFFQTLPQWEIPLPGRWLMGDVVVTQTTVIDTQRATPGPPPSAVVGSEPFDVSFVVTHPLFGETLRIGGRYWPQKDIL